MIKAVHTAQHDRCGEALHDFEKPSYMIKEAHLLQMPHKMAGGLGRVH